MYGCESWTIKKAERRRTETFELWCWKRLLRVPWTARRSSQSILKEISPKFSLEGLMLKLKLQYFGLLMRRTDSLERSWWWERLKAGGGMRWLDGITDLMDMSLSRLWELVMDREAGVLQSMGSWRVRHDWATKLNWYITLGKEMATHSSILAWRIPWTEEPARLQSMGSQRVRQDWVTNTHTTH